MFQEEFVVIDYKLVETHKKPKKDKRGTTTGLK